MLLQRGIYEGRFFQRWMAGLLEAKGITTFGQLADPRTPDLKSRYRLR